MKKSFGEKFKSLFAKKDKINEEFYEDSTDILVEGDIGAKASFEIVDELEKICKQEKITSQEEILQKLKQLLLQNVYSIDLQPTKDKQNVWMVLGVNGVGKTTTVAKMANMFKNQGLENVVLASADTFRAAAIEQLEMHGNNIGVRVVSHQHGSDPSAVVFDVSARSLISPATTTKLFPAAPALTASICALKLKIFVWSASLVIESRTSSIFSDASPIFSMFLLSSL